MGVAPTRTFMRAPAFRDLKNAEERLKGVVVETPLVRNDALDAACGARVFVKAEVLQRTGSFKIRGAFNRLSRLDANERRAGVVAFSSGNHAQGVAAAARLVGCPALIVMPADAPKTKIEGTLAFGAQIEFYDRLTQDRVAIAERRATERGAVLVPSYDDPYVIAGQGTLGLEAVAQLEAFGVAADEVVVPTSGGGLLAGVALAFETLASRSRIWSAEPQGFDDHRRSFERGERVGNEPGATSIADALLASVPGVLTWEINASRVAGGYVVTDSEIRMAIAFAFRELKLVLEPGGAVALAAALCRRTKGATLLVIASGGNVDGAEYAACFARGLSAR